jgi:excisionase family DNA binding protein
MVSQINRTTQRHQESIMLPNYLTVNEVAKALRISPITCRARISKGLIPAVRFAGSSSPLIDENELKKSLFRLSSVRALQEPFDRTKDRNKSEEAQYKELVGRVCRLASAVGSNAITLLLRTYGVQVINDLHPAHYRSFRGKLLRLSIGRK